MSWSLFALFRAAPGTPRKPARHVRHAGGLPQGKMTLASPTPSLTSPWSCRASRCTGPSAWTPGGECIP